MFLFGIALNAHAHDGSGIGTANPSSVLIGSSGNNIDLTYTATEAVGDGSIKLTIPNDWPAPNSGNTEVVVQNGFLADILDLVNPPTIGGSNGWGINSSILGLTLGLPLLTPSVSADSEAQDVLEGSHSLSVKNNIVLGVGLLGTPLLKSDVFKNLDPAEDWSGYERLSFWIKLDQFLAAELDLASSDFVIASGANLGGSTEVYDLDDAILRVGLLGSEEWTQVIIDLTKDNTTNAPSNVGSFGLSLRTGAIGLQLNVLTEANLDCFKLGGGDAEPVFSGNMVTANLLSLEDGGKVIFNYDGITAPNEVGQYTFPIQMREDCSGTLTNLFTGSPKISVIDLGGGGDGGGDDGGDNGGGDNGGDNGGGDNGGGDNGGGENCEADTVTDDPDSDGSNETAVDLDDDCCFGDAFFDQDESSTVCRNIDGSNDDCEDFFLDTDGDGCGECPEIFWDPTNGVISDVTENNQIDINDDGINDTVCAYDSDGDGEDDSFINPKPGSEDDSGAGGEGGGGGNPFVSGSGSCSLNPAAQPLTSFLWMPLTLLFLLLNRMVRRTDS